MFTEKGIAIMAIGFARFKFVKRSNGQNACLKSAYNSKTSIHFEGTRLQGETHYSFVNVREKPAHSTVILPDHVDKKFLDRGVLWNLVEQTENRLNSQVCWEMVFALPDDACVTLEDRIELCNRFVKECFVSYGSAVQIDIHPPTEDKNWHAHFLGTLREFNEEGTDFVPNKMRDGFIPDVRFGIPIFPEKWAKYAIDLQNKFFIEKGYDIRVDPKGIVPQKHIGPVRFRARSQSLIEENDIKRELNQIALRDPQKLLDHIVTSHSIFDYETVDFYIQKIEGLTYSEQTDLLQEFWKISDIVPLFHEDTRKFSGSYTIQKVIKEESSILRNAERLIKRNTFKIDFDVDSEKFSKHLNNEQKEAFKRVIESCDLSCINGLAGTGKSTLLVSLKDLYESNGYTVRGFGPDSATSSVLEQKGFTGSENIHRFLFNYKNQNREVLSGNEVWIIDESSKIANTSFNELLKLAVSKDVKLIFTGDVSQLSPVERGTAFTKLCDKFGFVNLEDIQRQESKTDREIVKLLSERTKDHLRKEGINKAIELMEEKGTIRWCDDKITSIKSLISAWAKDGALDSSSSSCIVALKRSEVTVINDVVRMYRKKCGLLGEKDYLCNTAVGTFVFSEKDVLLFRQRSTNLGIETGDRGVVQGISKESISVLMEKNNKIVQISPNEYAHFELGYASTNFGSQGATFDRSYVLASPQMKQEAYYVAASRHRKGFKLFVSKDEISSLAKLKFLASRKSVAATTFGLVTKEELEKKDHLEDLKGSNSIFKRTYGKAKEAISKWDIWTKHQDLSENIEFYRPKIDRKKGFELTALENQNQIPSRIISNSSYIKSSDSIVLDGVNASYQRKLLEPQEMTIKYDNSASGNSMVASDGDHKEQLSYFSEFVDNLCKEVESLKSFKSNNLNTGSLSFEKASVLSDYHLANIDCKNLMKDGLGSSFLEVKRAIESRNSLAYNTKKSLSSDELKSVLGEDSLKELHSFSKKHEAHLNKVQFKDTPERVSSNRQTANKKTQKGSLEQEKPPESLSLGGLSMPREESVNRQLNLSRSKRSLLDEYTKRSIEASNLYDRGKNESTEKGIGFQNTSVSQEFFHAASKRNEAAYTLKKSLSTVEISKIFNENEKRYINQRADKYEESLRQNQKNSPEHIENLLKERMEDLCISLFPDGYSSKTGSSMRFGHKGSLSVKVTGKYAGTFKDFENQDSGGPINLIRKVKGYDFSQSMEFAKNFLSLPVSNHISKVSRVKEESKWISVQPPLGTNIPRLIDVNPGLCDSFNEVSRHDYRDKQGYLLFCVLRLEPKDGGSKQIRPLSYGFDQNNPSKKYWKTIGYQTEKKAIYGLEKLNLNPSAPVLIVEGEKTADAATKMFEKEGVVVISWLGGTGSVDKVDWSHLQGKNVTIWPDNDTAGFTASNSICSHLRKIGVSSLKQVDIKVLEKNFPKKWDLADELPNGVTKSIVRDLWLSAQEKCVPLESLLINLDSPRDSKNNTEFKRFSLDILSSVEDRLRDDLEKKHPNKPWDVKHEIIKEASSVLASKSDISKQLESFGVYGSVNDRLTVQFLYRMAESGVKPSLTLAGELKQDLQAVGNLVNTYRNIDKELVDGAFDKVFLNSSKNGGMDTSIRQFRNSLEEEIRRQTRSMAEVALQDVASKERSSTRQAQIDLG